MLHKSKWVWFYVGPDAMRFLRWSFFLGILPRGSVRGCCMQPFGLSIEAGLEMPAFIRQYGGRSRGPASFIGRCSAICGFSWPHYFRIRTAPKVKACKTPNPT